jgi:hypothetical protein
MTLSISDVKAPIGQHGSGSGCRPGRQHLFSKDDIKLLGIGLGNDEFTIATQREDSTVGAERK